MLYDVRHKQIQWNAKPEVVFCRPHSISVHVIDWRGYASGNGNN